MGTAANPMASSNLTRFHPAPAAKASGTPLQRWNTYVNHQVKVTQSKRRLPKTQQQWEQERRG